MAWRGLTAAGCHAVVCAARQLCAAVTGWAPTGARSGAGIDGPDFTHGQFPLKEQGYAAPVGRDPGIHVV